MTFNPNDHLTKLSGKDYLEVKWRLVWLRDQHPNASIVVEHVDIDVERGHAIFRSTVSIPDGGSATEYGSESAKDFRDYIEKAATKATGRALAALGFGTQFTGDELAEGDRIVDSPVQRSTPRQEAPPVQREMPQERGNIAPGVGMTDQQRKAIWAIAKNERAMTDTDLELMSMSMFGVELKALDKQQASTMIETLKQTGEPAPHPVVQQAIDNRDSSWIAAMEGAATVGELKRIGAEIAQSGVKEGPLRAVYAKQLDRLQDKALA